MDAAPGTGTGKIAKIKRRDAGTISRLVAVWESAVKATHHFLAPGEMDALRPEVEGVLAAIDQLVCFSWGSVIKGFIGVAKGKIEMLFVADDARGQGIGRQLLVYAENELDAVYVDVNEQNTQGVEFYTHMGFVPMGRSALDDQGRPYPILHLKRNFYTQKELAEALRAIDSTIKKCEKYSQSWRRAPPSTPCWCGVSRRFASRPN